MEDKWAKVIVHASTFFSAFYISMLVPILFFILSKDEHVKRLSIQALLFQLVMSILITISASLSVILIGIPFLIVFVLMTVIVPIIGIVKALNDTYWNYPIVGRWV